MTHTEIEKIVAELRVQVVGKIKAGNIPENEVAGEVIKEVERACDKWVADQPFSKLADFLESTQMEGASAQNAQGYLEFGPAQTSPLRVCMEVVANILASEVEPEVLNDLDPSQPVDVDDLIRDLTKEACDHLGTITNPYEVTDKAGELAYGWLFTQRDTVVLDTADKLGYNRQLEADPFAYAERQLGRVIIRNLRKIYGFDKAEQQPA